MNKTFRISFARGAAACAAFFASIASSAPTADEPTRDDGVIDLLFLGHGQREGSGYHLSHVYAPLFNRSLGAEMIRMRYEEDPAVLNSDDLAQTDVLLIYANHKRLEPEQEKALLEFVEQGGGFLPVHCASACFGHSQPYVDLVGGRFKSHGYESFTVRIPDGMESHPILEGYELFETKDETYVHADHNEENRAVLMLREDEPWTWTREQGEGRVFYTAYGHDENTWDQKAFRELLIRGILWSVGPEKAEANRARVATLPELQYEDADTIPNYRRMDPAPNLAKPFSPADSAKLSLTQSGFEMRLFAAEPDIVNPVAFAWDERGRLFVAETVDYPNNVLPDQRGNDRITICEDTDGDGRADTFTVFADGLNIPTGLTPVDGGWIVAQAPYFLFLKDTDGDDRADVKRVLNDGWGVRDTHAGPSNLRYGHDNKIWGAVGYSEVENSTQGAFGQGLFRMDPDGQYVEPVGMFSNNTWGLGISEDFEIFGSTANNAPAWHVPLWRRFAYDRHEALPPQLAAKIDDFTQFFPITHNFLQVDAHGRYTAGSGFNLYTARAYPERYWNRGAFVGEPTGHLLGQFFLEEDGASYEAQNRGSFVASMDEWLAPVFTDVGPDGQLWVADWYNFIIQHNPRPSESSAGFEGQMGAGNAHENPLRDRHHGRIYRIVAKGSEPAPKLDLSQASTAELVEVLANDNLFWRLTAQRKLVGEKRVDATPELLRIVREDRSQDAIGLNPRVIHAIWTLQGLDGFSVSTSGLEQAIRAALDHPSAAVRKNAVMALTESGEPADLKLAASLIDDPDAKTRLRSLVALGLLPPSEQTAKRLFERRGELPRDPWIGRAFAYAALENEAFYLNELLTNKKAPEGNPLALYEKVEEAPDYLIARRYLESVEGDFEKAIGNWRALPASSIAPISLALLDAWKTKLREPTASELAALQSMVEMLDADRQMELKLRSPGLALNFPKIDPEAYAEYAKRHTFEPNVWGWGDEEDGAELYKQHCVACHGSEAQGDLGLQAPSLAGMENWYTQIQLQKFKAGLRGAHFKNPEGIAMRSALELVRSEGDPNRSFSHLAHYLATLEPARSEATVEGDVASGEVHYALCVACHGESAQGNPELGSPKLTGKQDWYLLKQLQAFHEGVRGSDPRDVTGGQMAALAQALPDEEAMKDVIAYIRSLDGKDR